MPTKRSAQHAQAVVGRRLRHLRLERGWSQERLAEACGLHWTYIGRVERGCRNLTLASLVALARGLRVSVGELVDGL